MPPPPPLFTLYSGYSRPPDSPKLSVLLRSLERVLPTIAKRRHFSLAIELLSRRPPSLWVFCCRHLVRRQSFDCAPPPWGSRITVDLFTSRYPLSRWTKLSLPESLCAHLFHVPTPTVRLVYDRDELPIVLDAWGCAKIPEDSLF